MNSQYLFAQRDPSLGKGFPVKNLQEVGNGIYRGQYDFDKMSSTDKLRLLQHTKFNNLSKKILQPSGV